MIPFNFISNSQPRFIYVLAKLRNILLCHVNNFEFVNNEVVIIDI